VKEVPVLEKREERAAMMSQHRTKLAEESIARHRARFNHRRTLQTERARGPTTGVGLDPGDKVRHLSRARREAPQGGLPGEARLTSCMT
jgi:hypothetical protein